MSELVAARQDEAWLLDALARPAFIQSPFEVYRELLARPGWRSPSGYRVFTRFSDLMEILRDPASFGQEVVPYPNFHVTNPPEHTRLRRLVSRAFTPKSVARQRKMIEDFVSGLLDEVQPEGRMDLVARLALPLPALVTAAMLDVPAGDAQQWHGWLDSIGQYRGTVPYLRQDPAEQARRAAIAGAAATATADYLRSLIIDRQRDPNRDDVVSVLLSASEGDDSLTEDEILFTLVLILGAGLHTTASQMANIVRAILERPAVRRELVRDPGLIDNAVEEGLRFDGSLQAEFRVARRDAAVADVEISEGEHLLIVNGAANRDPAVFPDPDDFDIRRHNAKEHLTLGWGIHRCLGAELARSELQVAVGQLIARFDNLRLDGVAEQHSFDRWRGLSSLPVAWDA